MKKIILNIAKIVLNPIVLVFVVVSTLGFELFMDFNKDTLLITNSAFAAVLAIAGVCFSYARVLDSAKADRALVVYSAEMFLAASISLLLISIFKLSFQALLSVDFISLNVTLHSTVKVIAMIYVFIFLLTSAYTLYVALSCLGYYLFTKLFIVYHNNEQETLYTDFLKKYTG